MFKPNRLIYRRMEGLKNFLEEGVPNATRYVLEHPAEIVDEVSRGVKKAMEGVYRQTKGVMHGVTEGVIEEGIEHVLLEDLPAGPKSLIYDAAIGAKEMTWDTAKNVANGEGLAAGKSFFGGLWKWARAVPRAIWKQGKGLMNSFMDTSRGLTTIGAHFLGVKTEEEGKKIVLRDHGLVKALGNVVVGAAGVLISPLGTRLQRRMATSTFRFDVSASKW